MASKHIMVKNVRLWYHSLKKTSYIPEKDSITGKQIGQMVLLLMI